MTARSSFADWSALRELRVYGVSKLIGATFSRSKRVSDGYIMRIRPILKNGVKNGVRITF
jgi:hypothetical protein